MRSFCWLLPAVFLTGCGGKLPVGHGRPVSGEVVYNGQPLSGATVTFYSVSESAFGETDEQGKFRLRTAAGELLPLGDYQVAVSKTDAPPPGPSPTPESYVPPPSDAPLEPPSKELIPSEYTDPQTSKLKATVSESGPNDFRFELSD